MTVTCTQPSGPPHGHPKESYTLQRHTHASRPTPTQRQPRETATRSWTHPKPNEDSHRTSVTQPHSDSRTATATHRHPRWLCSWGQGPPASAPPPAPSAAPARRLPSPSSRCTREDTITGAELPTWTGRSRGRRTPPGWGGGRPKALSLTPVSAVSAAARARSA